MPKESVAYFAAVQYNNLNIAWDVFTRDDDRQHWIEQHRAGKVYEGIHVVAVAQGEGVWVGVEEEKES